MNRVPSGSLLAETHLLLQRYGVKPHKRLGQTFMVDPGLLNTMVQYAEVERQDTVLEVGAGLGHLTRRLAEKAGRVLAVEIDRRLVEGLETELEGYRNVTIIQGDIRKVELPPFNKVVSNPPYTVSSDLILMLLDRRFDLAILTFQNEFVGKLTASPGTDAYGRLTVLAGASWLVQRFERVSRTAFFPVPRVDSTMVRISPVETPVRVAEGSPFLDLVTFLFSQRRRKAGTALRSYIAKRSAGTDVTRDLARFPNMDRRVYELPVEAFVLLANLVRAEETTIGPSEPENCRRRMASYGTFSQTEGPNHSTRRGAPSLFKPRQ